MKFTVPPHTRIGPAKSLPAQPPIPLPALLEKKLRALRRHAKFIACVAGACVLISAIVLLLLAQTTADYWFDIPWVARALFLLLDVTFWAVLYRRHLHGPLSKKLSLSQTALMVEKKWPRLGQAVVSAVELSDGRFGATRGSAQLVEKVLEQAVAQTKDLDFNQVVPTQKLRRWLMWASIITLSALALAVLEWPASGTLLERLFLLNVPLPTKTVVLPITRDLTVPVGTDVEIRARATGVIPTHGRVTISHDGSAPEEIPLPALAGHPDTFAYTVHNVQQPFHYQFFLNDGHGPEFTVTAKVPPEVSSVQFTEIFPAYTGLPPQILPPTSLSLLAGSHLKIKATSTNPLTSAQVVLQGLSQKIDVTLDSSKTAIDSNIVIPARNLTGLSIHLVDNAGLSSTNETIYPIDLVPDKPPVVKIFEPEGETETITLRAKPVIVFDASDDYGLTQLSLNYQVTLPPIAGQVEGVPQQMQRIPIPIKPPKEGTHYEYALDIPSLLPAWQEGWSINYWIEATDNNTATGPGVTRTEQKQFVIVSAAEKEVEIVERIKKNAADIDSLSNNQQDVSHDVQTTIPKK